jgi:hypothetical protein
MFCFTDTEQDPPFGVLSCEFTAWSGVSCTLDETWVYRMLCHLGIQAVAEEDGH